jgi:hypothetical protein
MSTDAIIDALGYPGAMLSGMKQNPPGTEGHTIYWNACVFEKTGKNEAVQIWHGDLDVTAQTEKLQELANRLGKTLVVTPEHPWRFDGFRKAMQEHSPKWDRPVFTFDPQAQEKPNR